MVARAETGQETEQEEVFWDHDNAKRMDYCDRKIIEEICKKQWTGHVSCGFVQDVFCTPTKLFWKQNQNYGNKLDKDCKELMKTVEHFPPFMGMGELLSKMSISLHLKIF